MTFRIQWFLYQYALHTIIVDLDLPMIDLKVVMLCWFYQMLWIIMQSLPGLQHPQRRTASMDGSMLLRQVRCGPPDL